MKSIYYGASKLRLIIMNQKIRGRTDTSLRKSFQVTGVSQTTQEQNCQTGERSKLIVETTTLVIFTNEQVRTLDADMYNLQYMNNHVQWSTMQDSNIIRTNTRANLKRNLIPQLVGPMCQHPTSARVPFPLTGQNHVGPNG